MLELEGFNVIRAPDGEEGLERAAQKGIRLILLDLKLPGLGGWDVLRKLKADPRLSAIPVIVFTALASRSEMDTSLRLGAVDHLIKPLSAAALKKSIAAALGARV